MRRERLKYGLFPALITLGGFSLLSCSDDNSTATTTPQISTESYDSWRSCTSDSQCEVVSIGCPGSCGGGLQGAINSSHHADWEAAYDALDCSESAPKEACAAEPFRVNSELATESICLNNICEVVYDEQMDHGEPDRDFKYELSYTYGAGLIVCIPEIECPLSGSFRIDAVTRNLRGIAYGNKGTSCNGNVEISVSQLSEIRNLVEALTYSYVLRPIDECVTDQDTQTVSIDYQSYAVEGTSSSCGPYSKLESGACDLIAYLKTLADSLVWSGDGCSLDTDTFFACSM